MKRNILIILAAVLLVTAAAVQGRGDLASYMDGVVVDAGIFNGTADTSSKATMDGRVGAALVVVTGVVDNVAGTLGNVVLQDSTTIASWTTRDSIAVDSVDNKYYDLHYRRTGPNVKIRIITRGGAAADSVHRNIAILRSCQRAPC
jgi:hypothetical protein